MNVTYVCPACDEVSYAELGDGAVSVLKCTHCGHESAVPEGALSPGKIERCVICPSTDLYVRKDFSQRWGVGIVLAGFVASSVAWYYYHIFATYAILFATALLDVILYLFMGNLLQCYRCQAQYRGVEGLEGHGAFNLETHERHRQQLARLAEARGKSGPAVERRG